MTRETCVYVQYRPIFSDRFGLRLVKSMIGGLWSGQEGRPLPEHSATAAWFSSLSPAASLSGVTTTFCLGLEAALPQLLQAALWMSDGLAESSDS